MNRAFGLLLAVLGMNCCLVPATATAQQLSINIHGTPFSCRANNGQPVPIYTNFQAAQAAAQLGGARADYVNGRYMIALNIRMLNQTPPRAAVMVFMHECGHVALPPGVGLGTPLQERNADCWAAKQMVRAGFIKNQQQFQEAVAYVAQIGGMNGFTQQRIQAMWQCAANAF